MIVNTRFLLVQPVRRSACINAASKRVALWQRQQQQRQGCSYNLRTSFFSTLPSMEKGNDKEETKVTVPQPPPPATPASSSISSVVKSSILPGIVLSASTAAVGFSLADVVSSAAGMPLSGIPVSILLGMTINNTLGVSKMFQSGVTYSTKTILQGGIVAVAAKLSFVELMTTGSAGLPVVVASVGAGLTLIPMAGRLAGLPREMSLLLTAGTSICGVTAITALAPAINANNRDIAVAVANTVAFGTIGMITYPYLFHALCHSSEHVGMCLGVAIHDTSQVLGAAMSYNETFGDDVALKTAAITKLTRNLGLAFAIPGLTYAHAIEQQSKQQETNTEGIIGDSISGLNTFQKYVPPFLVAFVGMSCLRSTGDLFLDEQHLELFQQTMGFIGSDISKYALGTAMAGVGLSTSVSSLKGVGWKPFAVGGAGALTVGGIGFTVASFVA